jgi:hypothetical protein
VSSFADYPNKRSVRSESSASIGITVFSFDYVPSDHIVMEPSFKGTSVVNLVSAEATQMKQTNVSDTASPKDMGKTQTPKTDVASISLAEQNSKTTTNATRGNVVSTLLASNGASKLDESKVVAELIPSPCQRDRISSPPNIVEESVFQTAYG